MLYGVDVSHWQGTFDFEKAYREGFSFAGLKACEGTASIDPTFHSNLAAARAAFGKRRVIAYHFQRPGNAAGQAALIKRTVPKDCTVALDVEDVATNFTTSAAIAASLKAAGYRVGVYTGHSFWTDHGYPYLRNWASFLWSARYLDMKPGYASVELAGTPTSFWDGYGGWIKADILQFTPVGKVAGQQVDCDAFNGTAAQLEELFYGTTTKEKPVTDTLTIDQIVKALVTYKEHSTDSDLIDYIRSAFNNTQALKAELDDVKSELAAIKAKIA